MIEYWPKSGDSLLAINEPQYTFHVKWTKNYTVDYQKMAFDYAKCGTAVFVEVINCYQDNVKNDAWFLAGIYLVRQAMELGIKALICRTAVNTPFIQDTFLNCQHDLEALFNVYDSSSEKYLTVDEVTWLKTYLSSLEIVDQKSDMFRFPFDDIFLSQYRDKFLDVVDVANNLLQAFSLIEKCINRGCIQPDSAFDSKLLPSFLIFATHGYGNCYLWQPITDEGFYAKVQGYNDVAQFLFEKCSGITLEEKAFPLLFLLRNSIELGLKRLFYARVEHGLSPKIFFSKRNSHRIKKDLWKSVCPTIEHYATEAGEDMFVLSLVEAQLTEVESIDKNGDNFRYPTSFSLEYRVNDIDLDIKNVYEFMLGIINFLNGCDALLEHISDCEADMRNEYGYY